MKLIVGLGNPGREYAATRHNIGFMVIDRLLAMFPAQPLPANPLAQLYQATISAQPALLLKPQTYMNHSGLAVQHVLQSYQAPAENLVVIYDDLDLEVGRLRIRKHGGHGGHKGIRSIIEEIGTKMFARMRMGIGRPVADSPDGAPTGREDVVEYVLQPFPPADQPLITDAIERAAAALRLIAADQMETAMNLYNGR